MTASRIAVGTVQFGLPYGVANQTGQVSREEGARMLALASSAGCDTLDTAIAYGESEARLGEIGLGEWRVVTKLPAIPAEVADGRAWVGEMLAGSLRRLRTGSVYGLLLHRAADLLGGRGGEIVAGLRDAREAGLVQRIGVSIYDPEELGALTERFSFDIVQAPFNVLDRRLVRSGWAARLRDRGVEIHTRSAFLQGLLLMPAETRPERFARFSPVFEAWDAWLARARVTALEACLGAALAEPTIDRVVVGADSEAHLKEILAAAVSATATPPESLGSDDPLLLNPSMWSSL